MIRIEKSLWLEHTFVEVIFFTNLLSQPIAEFETLTPKEQDHFRQTQVFASEKIRLLGHFNQFSLTMKYDGTLGWLLQSQTKELPGVKTFDPYPNKYHSPMGFLKSCLGTPYVWGGLSREGIDCSGLSQLYYLQVLGHILPKNSHDQRRLGKEVDLSEISDHNLLFCHRHDGVGTHHVAIYYHHQIWHARRTGGVVTQTLSSFLALYRVESIKSIHFFA